MFRDIPWSSATVQTAIAGIATAWASYFTKQTDLSVAIGATFVGAAVIFQRRATEEAIEVSTTTLLKGEVKP